MTTQSTPAERREAFIRDIVEVCKRHRVMIDYLHRFVGMDEHRRETFQVDMFQIDEAVWPVVHRESQ